MKRSKIRVYTLEKNDKLIINNTPYKVSNCKGCKYCEIHFLVCDLLLNNSNNIQIDCKFNSLKKMKDVENENIISFDLSDN